MTRTQTGVNMVPGAERKGCSARTEDTSQLDLPNPNQAAMPNLQKNSNIYQARIGDTTSSKIRLQEGRQRRDAIAIRSGGVGPRVSPELEEGRSLRP